MHSIFPLFPLRKAPFKAQKAPRDQGEALNQFIDSKFSPAKGEVIKQTPELRKQAAIVLDYDQEKKRLSEALDNLALAESLGPNRSEWWKGVFAWTGFAGIALGTFWGVEYVKAQLDSYWTSADMECNQNHIFNLSRLRGNGNEEHLTWKMFGWTETVDKNSSDSITPKTNDFPVLDSQERQLAQLLYVQAQNAKNYGELKPVYQTWMKEVIIPNSNLTKSEKAALTQEIMKVSDEVFRRAQEGFAKKQTGLQANLDSLNNDKAFYGPAALIAIIVSIAAMGLAAPHETGLLFQDSRKSKMRHTLGQLNHSLEMELHQIAGQVTTRIRRKEALEKLVSEQQPPKKDIVLRLQEGITTEGHFTYTDAADYFKQDPYKARPEARDLMASQLKKSQALLRASLSGQGELTHTDEDGYYKKFPYPKRSKVLGGTQK